MKTTKSNQVLLVALMFLWVVITMSCKKNNSDNNSQTPAPTSTNYLCDGNGKNSYWPLAYHYAWHMHKLSSTSVFNFLITDSIPRGSKYYYRISDPSGYYFDEFLRMDSLGNIYQFDDQVSNMEYMWLPINPIINQSWNYGTVNILETITSIDASVVQNGCTYNHVLVIVETENGALRNTYYYKKGIGRIRIGLGTSGIYDTVLDSVKIN